MSTDTSRDASDEHAGHRKAATATAAAPTHDAAQQAPTEINLHYVMSLLGNTTLDGRGNSGLRASTMQRAQQMHGNHAVQRFLQYSSGEAQLSDDPLARRIDAAPVALSARTDSSVSGLHHSGSATVAAARAVPVQRFQVGFGPGMTPVHQEITAEALQEAGMLGAGGTYEDPAAQEYSRGVLWNDDPLGQLMKPDKFERDLGGVLDYGHDFMNFEKEAVKRSAEGKAGFGPGENMLARTHFGDLGFLHGMAADDKEDPKKTKEKMMMWANFSARVAKGEIKGDASLADLGKGKDPNSDKDDDPQLREIAKLFPEMKGKNINDLFGIKDGKGDVQKRAMGSLLHMTQDSYAGGHSERDADGKVKTFHSYTNQDHDAHGDSDKIGEGDTLKEQLANTKGAPEAIHQSAALLKMLNDPKVSADDVLKHMDKDVFALADPSKLKEAGPGTGYEKNPDPSMWEKIKGSVVSTGKEAIVDGLWNVKEAGKWVGEKATNAWDWVSDKAGGAWDATKKAGSWLGDKATDAWDATKGIAGDAWDATKKAGNWIGDQASSAWDATKGVASDAWDATKSAGNWIGDQASSAWSATKGAASDAWGGIKSAGNWVGDQASSAWDTTKGAASDAWDATKRGANAVGGAATSAWNATTGAAESVGKGVGSAWDWATSW